MKQSVPAWEAPEAFFSGLWTRVPAYIRLSFLSAVVLGLATHLYVFANKLTNHDDIDQMFYAGYGTASGRWLLPSILRLDGEFSIPWLIGLLGVLCLAGTVCFTVALLRIRRPLWCVVTAAVMVSFPTVASTFSYMFTAGAYFFGLLLAAFGAYAAVRWGWWGSALGAAAVTLSLGVYQSYFPVAAVLMVGALLFEALDGERTFRELFLRGVRLAGTLAAAMAAYLVIARLAAGDAGLSDYKGISSMGQIPLAKFPHLVLEGCRSCIAFFLGNSLGWHFDFLKFAFMAVGLCCVVLGVLLARGRRLDAGRTALAVALVVVYPLACSLIYVMAAGTSVHTVMIYGFVYILVFPIALVDYAGLNLNHAPFRAAAGWVILLTMVLTAYSYAVTDNNGYLKADLSMRQCVAYSNRLLERVEACEGYCPGMDVVLLGSGTEGEGLSPTPELDDVEITGILDLSDFRTSWSYDDFLRYYLGFSGRVYTGGYNRAVTSVFEAMDEVQAMPVYPETGSVRVINDTVVVKLNG